MAGSTEGNRVDESALTPDRTAYRPPLRAKSDRLGVSVTAGKHFNASVDAVVHGHGNSPIGFTVVVITAAVVATLAVVLCQWLRAPGWVDFVTAFLLFAGLTIGGIRFISGKPRACPTRSKRRSNARNGRRSH